MTELGASLKLWSPTLWALRTGIMEEFFHGLGMGGSNGFQMIQAHYIYCALYFCCYIVTYNEIIMQLAIMHNQWVP